MSDLNKLNKAAMICGLLISLTIGHVVGQSDRPNIIIILADDLGWDDVGFHGSRQIPTPNLDALAYDGIVLGNYYVQPLCTPSRAALLTGRYPIHLGLQHGVIVSAQPFGLPLNETILPQYLKDLGYASHIVGKWHLGFMANEYTPTYRGFDSHYGYYQGCADYFDHTYLGTWPDDHKSWGFDFHCNMKVERNTFGQYSTELFTTQAEHIIAKHNSSQPLFLYMAHQAVHSGNPVTPLEAPWKYIQRVSHITSRTRRHYAAMVSALDESVGNMTRALFERGMLNNTIIIFSTDNGGPADGFDFNDASNAPLRGLKDTLWEGGVRGTGFIWSPHLHKSRYTSHHLMHITDWLPTLLHAVGNKKISDLPTDLDGIDQWDSLSNNLPSRREEVLLNIDPKYNASSIRLGDVKLVYAVKGHTRTCDGWYPSDSGRRHDDGGVYTPPCAEQESLNFHPADVFADSDVKRFRNDIQNDIPELDKPVAFHGLAYESDIQLHEDSVDHEMQVQHDVAEILAKLGHSAEPDTHPLIVKCGPRPANASTNCQPWRSPCLFNITADPCEFLNIASEHQDTIEMLLQRLQYHAHTAAPPLNKPVDDAGLPYHHNWTWVPWIKLDSQHTTHSDYHN